MTTTYKSTIRIFPTILCVLLCALFLLFAVPGQTVRADEAVSSESEYTDVLTDLTKDPDFDISEYPEDPNDYSIRLIQIAESVQNELFVYVYIPSADKKLSAKRINISTGINDNAKWIVYDLIELNKNGTLFKYKVNDFIIVSDVLRYYDISAISRQYYDDIDSDVLIIDPDPSVDFVERGYPVGQLWTVATLNNEVHYMMTYTEIITITQLFPGIIRYDANSLNIWQPDCDSFFVAFSTDKRMDKLLEADIEYYKREEYLKSVFNGGGTELTEPERIQASLSYDQKGSYNTGVFVVDTYEWSRIQSVDYFLKTENLSDSDKERFKNCDWVLRFLEADYVPGSDFGGMLAGAYLRTYVSDVIILRLKFETDGVVYNLGVVSDRGTGNSVLDGSKDDWLDWFKNLIERIIKFFVDNWHWIVIGVIGVILLIVCMPFMPLILQAVVTVFTALFKGLWWLISAPFKWIYRKIRGE